MLPKRRERPRMGVKEEIKREWRRHARWVRDHGCCVPGCKGGPIEFAHVREHPEVDGDHEAPGLGGEGVKPADWFGMSLCHDHHSEQHRGAKTFEAKYKISTLTFAREFARKSVDVAMRDYMREIGAVV